MTKSARLEQEVAIASLKPAAYNPRRIGDAEMAKLKASIQRFGFSDPVVANAKNRVVVGGHQRLKAAEALGMTHVPVAWVSLKAAEEKALNLALNKISGEWDNAALDEVLRGLLEGGDEDLLASTGFDMDEIDALLGNTGGGQPGLRAEPDALPSTAPTRVRPGELWAMGEHRLLCGDATLPEDYTKLLGGEVAAAMVTDPPYNVAYTGGTAEAMTIANDDMSSADFRSFLLAFYQAALANVREGGALYVWHADSEGENFRGALREAGWLLKQSIIWAKDRLVLSRQDYHWQHEPCLYGWRPGAAHFWHGDRKQTTVWEVDRPGRSEDHPTMKPVALFERCMVDVTLPGQIVLDPFAGSGTTMVACMSTGRVARLIELSPTYCDRILARWEMQTGLTAELLGG